MYNSIVLNIPHSSNVFKNRDGFVVDNLPDYNNEKIDVDTNKLYHPVNQPNVIPIIFQYSRFWCDVERFWDNSMEVEFSKGQGVIYTHDEKGVRYREITPKLSIECAVEYMSHWQRVENKLRTLKNSLLLDCHSYAHESNFPYFDVNIGYNDENIKAIEVIADIFKSVGYSIGYNEPFKGVYEIKPHDCIMIEVNKDAYNDSNKFEKVNNIINSIYRKLLNN
ncbi:MAG: N-formylglutamate amidohydrolase [Firmicutes bacterium]|nr:N-formylglutamate amidohydrolase [Bacillota bacterium]